MVSRVFSIVLLVWPTLLVGAQITEQDVRDIIASYRTAQVETLKRGMPPPQTDKVFRQSIYQNLPAEVLNNRIHNPELIGRLKKVLEPVLAFYNRQEVYDLMIVKSPVPLMMSDSGVVLVVTTGMIQQAESDDELLGYAAHEIGHEYFVHYSVESRRLMQTIGGQPALQRRMDEVLSLIELQCDAFSAVTLSSLGYDPLAFIRGVERTSQNYQDYSAKNHPTDAVRRRVVEGVSHLPHNPRVTEGLKELKKQLAGS
jgi:predicted Zn-dependent protease